MEQRLGPSKTWCLIWTLDRVRENCIECGDCWEWKGAIMANRYPAIRYKGQNGSGRRAVFEMSGRKLFRRSFIVVTCGNESCLNPDHLKQLTQAEHMRQLAKHGVQGGLVRAANIAKTKRKLLGKITMEQARQIRDSDETCKALAERYGMSAERISRIRKGTAWREYAGNPFAGLIS